MSRLLLTGFGALVQGLTFGVLIGFAAAFLFSRMPGGAREGGGAMAGLFVVGPIAAILGLGLGGYAVWRLSAHPERTGAIAAGLGVQLLVLGIGAAIALRPVRSERDDYPGRKAELLVEVDMPDTRLAALSKTDRLTFELRSGDGTEQTPALRAGARNEGGRAIVPATFPVRVTPRTKLLAVMHNDEQWMCSTLNVEPTDLDATTEWSPWQDLEEGMRARWRLVLTPAN